MNNLIIIKLDKKFVVIRKNIFVCIVQNLLIKKCIMNITYICKLFNYKFIMFLFMRNKF